MRVASIDMTDPSSTCPSGLRTVFESSHRLCAMNIDNGGCSSAILPVGGVQYSRVCGKIIGYQQESPDAFHGGQTTIDSHYVDGISLTHGNSPRKHIWTFVHEYNSHRDSVHTTIHLLQHLPLWVRTTSVTQAVRITFSTSS